MDGVAGGMGLLVAGFLQIGHVFFVVSQWVMHALSNACVQGSRTNNSWPNGLRQIAHDASVAGTAVTVAALEL